ncbi:MAG: transcriptional regulator [Planctomycetes bacterium RBG_16_55_9]|nr:MAG: transcriptional regulator [Planctomycetes bacterium RBG_16_55_9]
MKMVTAIVREEKLDQVREALIEAEITRITVCRVSGHGRQMQANIHRGKKVVPNLVPKVRLTIAVNDSFVEPTCEAIIRAARTGNEGAIGDGKIFITPLEECIRIRTGETGGNAI